MFGNSSNKGRQDTGPSGLWSEFPREDLILFMPNVDIWDIFYIGDQQMINKCANVGFTKGQVKDFEESKRWSPRKYEYGHSETLPGAPRGPRNSKIDVFFDLLLQATFPDFKLPQAPKKQPKYIKNRSQDCQSSFLARMHILSALPMKYTHFASSKSSKIRQN